MKRDEVEKSEDMAATLPVGIRFRPTDVELVEYYLLPKATAQPLPYQLPEEDLYGHKNPWELFPDLEDDQPRFAFTRLKNASGSKCRVARTAGCGTWKAQTGEIPVYDSRKAKIGLKKQFTFEGKNNGGDQRYGRWIMHEFSLAGIYRPQEESAFSGYVLCRIRRQPSSSNRSNKSVAVVAAASAVEPDFGAGEEENRRKRVRVVQLPEDLVQTAAGDAAGTSTANRQPSAPYQPAPTLCRTPCGLEPTHCQPPAIQDPSEAGSLPEISMESFAALEEVMRLNWEPSALLADLEDMDV